MNKTFDQNSTADGAAQAEDFSVKSKSWSRVTAGSVQAKIWYHVGALLRQTLMSPIVLLLKKRRILPKTENDDRVVNSASHTTLDIG